MNCPNCGYEDASEGARFCPNCGQRLYRMASLDHTELLTGRTQGFTQRE